MTRLATVRVNECKVFATTQGADWWVWFVIHQRARITTIVQSIAGNLVDVACEDREHAEWLAGQMVERGLPKSAVQVRA